MSAPETQSSRRDFLGRALAVLAGAALALRPRRVEAVPEQDQPFIGEIRMFAGNFAPVDWMFCEGQLLPISENEALFSLIGTTYGGDGQTTFALPDLRGRAPIHVGPNTFWGQMAGVENVTLTVSQIPAHTHVAGAGSANGVSDDPTGRVPARNAAGVPQYGTTADTSLATGALLSAGGSQSHSNVQPYLAINYIISLFGIFPSQT
jgi:microcystin-dependent protein